MNPQPTIFLSSIISEFYDLRGAMRYFLGKSGFRVLMSEEVDFGADCGKDSLDNCKDQITKSDYYLLLIGNNPGTVFQIDGKDTTVTFEEFKHYISLVRSGKTLNFIAFVRQQTWDNYTKKDVSKIDPLQIELIDELLNNSLFENKKIGRWRYTFNRFADIITILETNQNGLFLEATRKANLYRNYIKREIYDIFKSLVDKDIDTSMIQSPIHIIKLPELVHLDLIVKSKIDHKIATRIIVLLIIVSNKESVLRKINRVFNYIAQGEFSRFDPIREEYILPEYIKLTIQTLEILERIFDNSNNVEILVKFRNTDSNNFYINRIEYDIIKKLHDDLDTVIAKLANLTNCFAKGWNDLEAKPDIFYSFGKISGTRISDEDIIDFADNYFKKN